MNDLNEIKEEITNLVFTGKKEEAIALLQKKYGVGRDQAEKLLSLAIRESADPISFIKRVTRSMQSTQITGGGCKNTAFKMIAFGFGFLGIPILLAAIGLTILYKYEEQHSYLVEATVIEYNSYMDDNGEMQYTPIVAYTVNDKDYTYTATMYSNEKPYQLNETIQLHVIENDSEEVFINSFSERWLGVVIIGVIGGLFTLFMIILIFKSRSL